MFSNVALVKILSRKLRCTLAEQLGLHISTPDLVVLRFFVFIAVDFCVCLKRTFVSAAVQSFSYIFVFQQITAEKVQ